MTGTPHIPRRGFLLVAGAAALQGCRRDRPESVDRPVGRSRPVTPEGQHPLPQREPTVRVRVLRGRANDEPLEVGAIGQWIAIETPTSAGVPHRVLVGPIVVLRRAGRWQVRDANGRHVEIDDNTCVLRPIDAGGAELIAVDGIPYPGRLHCVARADGAAFDVINHLLIEAYLPGVLTGELFPDWHPGTYAAQAIAARSYACCERAHFRGRRAYDLTNTTRSQVYTGADARAIARAATWRTRGQVLTWNNGLVPGYYSSCCGGDAARAVDAIGPSPFNDLPPLHGRPTPDVCQDAPRRTWTMTRSRRDSKRRLIAWAKQNGREDLAALQQLASITIAKTNANNRPVRYRVTGADGTPIELAAESLRRALDYAAAGASAPERRLYAAHLTCAFNGDSINITGHGFGHGVGLCQYGAETLARRGDNPESILAWYYPGAVVRRAYA